MQIFSIQLCHLVYHNIYLEKANDIAAPLSIKIIIAEESEGFEISVGFPFPPNHFAPKTRRYFAWNYFCGHAPPHVDPRKKTKKQISPWNSKTFYGIRGGRDHLGVTVAKFICIIFALFAPFVVIAKIFLRSLRNCWKSGKAGPAYRGIKILGGSRDWHVNDRSDIQLTPNIRKHP